MENRNRYISKFDEGMIEKKFLITDYDKILGILENNFGVNEDEEIEIYKNSMSNEPTSYGEDIYVGTYNISSTIIDDLIDKHSISFDSLNSIIEKALYDGILIYTEIDDHGMLTITPMEMDGITYETLVFGEPDFYFELDLDEKYKIGKHSFLLREFLSIIGEEDFYNLMKNSFSYMMDNEIRNVWKKVELLKKGKKVKSIEFYTNIPIEGGVRYIVSEKDIVPYIENFIAENK